MNPSHLCCRTRAAAAVLLGATSFVGFVRRASAQAANGCRWKFSADTIFVGGEGLMVGSSMFAPGTLVPGTTPPLDRAWPFQVLDATCPPSRDVMHLSVKGYPGVVDLVSSAIEAVSTRGPGANVTGIVYVRRAGRLVHAAAWISDSGNVSIMPLDSALALAAVKRDTSPPAVAQVPAVAEAPDASPAGTITAEYDGFQDASVVQLDGLQFADLRFTFIYAAEGHNSRTSSGSTSLMITVKGDDWQYLQCHFLNILIDGRRAALGEAEHDGRVGDGYVLEFITATIPSTTLVHLAHATKIEGELCNSHFMLDGANTAAISRFVARTRLAVH